MRHIILSALLVGSSSAFFIFERQSGLEISSSGSCGSVNGIETTCLGSTQGNCCSFLGYCGSNSSYCGAGCQSKYGTCGNSKISTDGSCGGERGLTCLGATMGNCCSVNNFCGDTSGHCGEGCQTAFGDCYASGTGNTTSAAPSSTPTPTPLASASASAAAAPANSTSSTPSAVPVQKSKPTTETAGFKAGMAVMAIAIAGGILGIGFWFWRKRRPQKGATEISEVGGDGIYAQDRKELPGGAPDEAPVYHEIGGQQHTELDAKPWQDESAGPPVPEKHGRGSNTYELPGDTSRLNGPP